MRKMALLALPLVLAACGQGADNIETDAERLRVTADTSTAYATGAAAPVVPTIDSGGNATVAGNIQPINNSGLDGTLALTAVPNGTKLLLNVSQVQPNATLEVALERGQCGTPGQGANVVATVPVDASGRGVVETVIPLPATTVMNGEHMLLVKTERAGTATPPLGCASIPVNGPGPVQ